MWNRTVQNTLYGITIKESAHMEHLTQVLRANLKRGIPQVMGLAVISSTEFCYQWLLENRRVSRVHWIQGIQMGGKKLTLLPQGGQRNGVCLHSQRARHVLDLICQEMVSTIQWAILCLETAFPFCCLPKQTKSNSWASKHSVRSK